MRVDVALGTKLHIFKLVYFNGQFNRKITETKRQKNAEYRLL